MSETANRVIKNIGFLYIKMFFAMFATLWITRLILNSLGASDFGIFNIVGGAIGMLGFLNVAMAGATQRFMSYSDGAGDRNLKISIFNVSLVIHCGIALLLGLILLLMGYFFFENILNIPVGRIHAAKIIYGSLIVSTVFTVMTVPYDAVMNAHENMKYYSFIGILESCLKLVVAFITVYSSYDKLIVYGLLMAIIPLLTLTVMRIYCHRHYPECRFSPRRYWDNALFRRIISFAGWNFIGSSSIVIANYGLGIVVNIFNGVILNAALAIAQQLDGYLKVFSRTMLKAVEPVIVKKEGAGNTENMLNLTMTSTKFSFFMFSFFVVPCFIEMPYILKLWLKDVPDWTILFCRLQLITSLLGQLGATIDSAVAAHGKIRIFSIGTACCYFSSILLTYIFFRCGLPPYLMYVSVILLNVIAYRTLGLTVLHKYCGLSFRQFLGGVFCPCWIVLFITYIVSNAALLVEEGLGQLALCCIISTVSFVLAFLFIGMNSLERTTLFELIRRYIPVKN